MTSPRFMNDTQLKEHFGLSDRALTRLRATHLFPRKDGLIGKTDSRAVHFFFDRRIGLDSDSSRDNFVAVNDGKENFDGI
ncbi:hypothetical protein [Pararhizobium mangrovi]|uniref:DUF4224 domain-containing protein n=1 Tax=Pararhizobium mangrovi TaxID=2590452 RepID=A0A506TZJ4_9HYPH|nr:hypothetical protein [Pararhizobium mangrovi]TPW26401.1 hypothetical protein FJU11_15100 [Pararhizobium mangrovi]